MDIATLANAYQDGSLSPRVAVARIYDEIAEAGERPAWITLVPRENNLSRAKALETDPKARALPLFGIPFAVKDNFDVEGLPTTAACSAYGRIPTHTATVVQKLLDAGAILIGKTNMDQFATGLVGTRTPYGICSSVFNADYISGGSSSGSAVAVARGWVSFALGSDTAGSGRVPAAFNQLRRTQAHARLAQHRWSLARVPNPRLRFDLCRNLRRCCKGFRAGAGLRCGRSLLTGTAPGNDASPWSATKEFRFGVPQKLEFFGDQAAAALYAAAVDT